MSIEKFQGILSPVVTPFRADLAPDAARLIEQCRWLLDRGLHGLAVFGTTSEANSLSVDEKIDLLDALVAAGIAPAKLMPGTGCCALTDTVRLTKHAVTQGCAGVLMLPPFYYKAVDDDGLFASYAEAIERVGDDRLRVYLYHIPPVAQVGLGIDLIGRLKEAFPGVVVGIKDSSGDWNNTSAILTSHPDLTVFPGSEVFLLDGLRAGGAGCITATANVNPAAIAGVFAAWRTEPADELQAGIVRTRKIIQGYPVIPALKALLAHYRDDPDWAIVRPPLMALSDADRAVLVGELEATGFALGGNSIGR